MAKTIHVIGLGAGDLDQLPLGIYRKLKAASNVFMRTKDHPVVQDLINEGIQFQSFDHIYEAYEQFDEVYEAIVKELYAALEKQDTIVYAVPGHPMVAEATVQKLLHEENQIQIVVEGGQSFLDAAFNALKIDPIEGFQLIDGTELRTEELILTQHVLIGQVYDQMSASAVKLLLMERLPADFEVTVVTAAGSKKETLISVPLFELDRVTTLSNLTAVYIPPVREDNLLYRNFSKLRQVIQQLRGPGGCPWDQKQTHESLKKYLIEESYELLEAIDEEDDDHIVEELGDVLLQVLLHAQIGEDDGFFNVEDVIEGVTRKMIRRHPHVFANTEVDNADDVVTNWEAIKKEEKKEKGISEEEPSLLDGIPATLPGLLKAYKLQKKAGKVGFDWGEEAPMWDKLNEELAEWQVEMKEGRKDKSVEEFGDVLFAFVNIARFHEIDPEEALRKTNQKFSRRFQFIEKQVQQLGKPIEDFSLTELDEFWEEAKRQERE
ncbi:nucleoside triphosphate pyrophosphohydrolase [Salipaludibacillus neizhouensis]|uniref:Nucleoside triphosphate pyrophosphohydrolase n=1 Tax=Salipaludibacillus neizhouensis TaxID=885475 RepID=A0A3A9KCT7_9BACI|nr:nucleoside triphosphate pyrophosphohydrolase [Salipaludibacillus neizhouensis]RKL65215.1 nucleoside triphosphate pyrophosphohydrolase [Salipaludibacillus neizhouensis]